MLKEYKTSEVTRKLPKNVRKLEIDWPDGGHATYWLLRTAKGYRLYSGGCTDSEPIFRFHHVFKTRDEAVFYAQYNMMLSYSA